MKLLVGNFYLSRYFPQNPKHTASTGEDKFLAPYP